MLLNLALKNIRYYFKSYLVYLVTASFCAWTFAVFVSFLRGPVMGEIMGSHSYHMLFWMTAALLLLFAGIFILYSGAWFFEKRKREIGMYLLLGIKKSSISFLLIAENAVLGLISSAAGLAVGFLSAPLLERMISGPENAGSLSFSDAPWMLAGFAGLFILSAIYNVTSIGKSQLIELFKAEEKKEEPLHLSAGQAAASLAVLIGGYVCIFLVKNGSNIYLLPIGFGLVLIGTYFTVQQGTGFVAGHLRTSRSCTENLPARFNVTGILYRIRRCTGSWAAVSLLISISMGFVIIACTIYASAAEMVTEAKGAEERVSALLFLDLTKVMSFLMILVCIAFVAATASMLYFKVLSELHENRQSYEVLYELGAGKEMLGRVLRRQIAVMFLLPYLIGSVSTMLFAVYLMKSRLLESTLPVLIGAGGFAVVYLIYGALAVRNGRGMLAQVRRDETM